MTYRNLIKNKIQNAFGSFFVAFGLTILDIGEFITILFFIRNEKKPLREEMCL